MKQLGEIFPVVGSMNHTAEISYTGMDKLVCTPASNSLIACPGETVSRLYRHIRQAAIPARVVLGTAVF